MQMEARKQYKSRNAISFVFYNKSPTQTDPREAHHHSPQNRQGAALHPRSLSLNARITHLGFYISFLLWHIQCHDFFSLSLTVILSSACDKSFCLWCFSLSTQQLSMPLWSVVEEALGSLIVGGGGTVEAVGKSPTLCSSVSASIQWGCYCMLWRNHSFVFWKHLSA